jgi:hypothetical protein
MTHEQLKEVMKFHMKNFNGEGVEISESTFPNQVIAQESP